MRELASSDDPHLMFCPTLTHCGCKFGEREGRSPSHNGCGVGVVRRSRTTPTRERHLGRRSLPKPHPKELCNRHGLRPQGHPKV